MSTKTGLRRLTWVLSLGFAIVAFASLVISPHEKVAREFVGISAFMVAVIVFCVVWVLYFIIMWIGTGFRKQKK